MSRLPVCGRWHETPNIEKLSVGVDSQYGCHGSTESGHPPGIEWTVRFRSNYPIVKANGEEVEPLYKLDIESGKNTLVIAYNTYRHDYYCRFSWNAEANTVYEVTDQDNRYPLTLYHWVKVNSLWASRFDPMDPLECINKPRRVNTTDE